MTLSRRLLFNRLLIVGIILIGVFFRLHQITHLPPGDGFDPAYYGLDALRILDGEWPIYLATNYGREPMFSYLVAVLFLALGPGTLAIHLASAFVAILTIPAVYLVADELFKVGKGGFLRQYGGPLAALILALSYWHLTWSRFSVRAILIPLFVSATIFFLLRGFRKGGSREFAAAGVFLGLSLYTYQLAQLLPLIILLAFLYHAVRRRAFTRQDRRRLLLLFGIAILLCLPLAYYAYTHPGVFNQRISAVYVVDESTSLLAQIRLLLQRGWQVLLMFVIEGDSDEMINLPGRPVFNPFLALFFVAGILLALWRWRRPRYLLLLTWLAIMSAPAVLADQAAMSKRSLGALPGAILLITLAILWPIENWFSRRRRPWAKWALGLYVTIIAGGVLFTAYRTYHDYFIDWGSRPALYTHYQVGVKEIGQYIATLPPEETVYLSPTWGEHASLRLHSGRRDDIRAYNGRNCLVFPQETKTKTTYVVVPAEDQNTLSLLPRYFPQGQTIYEGVLANGAHYFTAYTIPAYAGAHFSPQYPLKANWDNQIQLLGYDLEETNFVDGDTITLNLYYRTLEEMSQDYTVFIHLRGQPDPASGNVVYGQSDREPCFRSYPTSSWQSGEVIRDTFTLTIPPETRAGTYQLATGFYSWPELTRLPLVDTAGAADGEAVILGEVPIVGSP